MVISVPFPNAKVAQLGRASPQKYFSSVGEGVSTLGNRMRIDLLPESQGGTLQKGKKNHYVFSFFSRRSNLRVCLGLVLGIPGGAKTSDMIGKREREKEREGLRTWF